MNSIETLEQFRKQTYDIIGKGRDALFDLMDAVLTTPSVSSLVEFSLSPVFQLVGLRGKKEPNALVIQRSERG